MKYIKDAALREYVKEELRVSMFQMAHKLAVQTGCEVLVKLEDSAEDAGCQYYATKTLNIQYTGKGLSKQPWEVMVSGITGMPVTNHSSQSRNKNGNMADEIEEYNMSNDGHDDEMDDSTEQVFAGDLNSTSQTDETGVIDETNQTRETIVHVIKSESGNPQDTLLVGDDSWTKTTVTLPFPVAIESALSGGDASGDTSNQTATMDQIQQQIYIYANTNTEDKGESQESAEVQDELGAEQFGIRRRTPPSLNYKCTLCQKCFSSVALLARHAKSHHSGDGDMRYHCIPCNKTYKHSRHLEQHTELHSKASYRCSTCCKGFYRSSTLREHELREHQGRYRYYCPKCHKGFMRPSTMQTHLNRVHPIWFGKSRALAASNVLKSQIENTARIVIPVSTDGDEEKLDAGDKNEPSTSGEQEQSPEPGAEDNDGEIVSRPVNPRTTVNEQLRNQTQKRTTKVAYQCKECGRMYENSNSLVRHIHDRHGGKAKLRCNSCSYRTSRTSDLARHKRAKHPINIGGAQRTSFVAILPKLPPKESS